MIILNKTRKKLLFILATIYLFSCTKTELVIAPTVITLEASSIQQKSVKIFGEVTDDGLGTILEKGFYLSKTNSNPTSQDKKISLGTGKGKFEIIIDSLTPNTKYFYKTFAKNSKGESNGNALNFTTLDIKGALLSTDIPQNISYYSVLLSGIINDDGGGTIKEKGFCLSTNPNPTINDLKFPVEKIDKSYSLVVIKLKENTTYYLRTYSINEKGEAYGNEQIFKTLKTQVPKVSTLPASNITQTSVKLSGSVIDDGGLEITEKGICYSLNNSPTIKDSKIGLGVGISQFIANLSSLPINSNIYFRAYAINQLGISYGEILSFTLTYTKTLTVITTPIFKSNSNDFLWHFGGEIKDDGGSSIEDVGIVIGLKANPTTADNFYQKSFMTKNITTPFIFNTFNNYDYFTFTKINMPSITYYIRAYANNSKERVYGNEIVYIAEPHYMEKQGGYIGYIFQKGDIGYVEGEEHGIIVSKTVFDPMEWGCAGTNLIGAEKSELGDGKFNTDDIVKDCSKSTTPASICKNLVLNGYSDWVLPSIKELLMIYRTREFRVPYLLESTGFWTSTEYDFAHAYIVKRLDREVRVLKSSKVPFIAIRYY
jgi:hypothetical protein